MPADTRSPGAAPDHDVIVVGAGFAGLNALHHFRANGLRCVVLEAGSGVGGTWYWNRYPGARVDIESLEYSYAFSDELQQEWTWPERYSEQPDVLRYLEWVADRLDLRRDIEFDTRLISAIFDEQAKRWTVTTADGRRLTARFCVMAVGFLSATHWPDIPGFARFEGELVHTGAWPQAGVDLTGRRVGVIGAGATTVQLVPRIAPQTGHLTVFQRTPNWCFPMNNMPMPAEYESRVKAIYPQIRRHEHEVRGAGVVLVGFEVRLPSDTKVFDVSAEEREREYEARWADCALHVGGSFGDLLTDQDANDTLRDFIERKIRSIVDDPGVAELLIPKNHPPFTRRPCGEAGYYAAFNRENVSLVDVATDPIAEITAHGLRLESGEEHELDVLISATGFDAGTGGLTRIDIRGRAGASLKDAWASGARTHLGMMSSGFPNMFFLNAVQSPSAFFSPPLLGDYQVRYIVRIIDQLDATGSAAIEPTSDAEEAWVGHVNDVVNATLLPQANSWWMGANIPGKPRQVVAYAGGFGEYRRRAEAAFDEGGLREFVLVR
ncbi:MAG: Baeyer-Villiger monooxygenase ue [Ilumatobacteraceae bacterium]|nr:Baeyer-Villiger monooxygenase ue [Ilumatobacteraceae bacterium]